MSEPQLPRPPIKHSAGLVIAMIAVGLIAGIFLGFGIAFVVGLFAMGGNLEGRPPRSSALVVIFIDLAPWVVSFFLGLHQARKGNTPIAALLMSAAAGALLPVTACTGGLLP